jgi:hypothetical protein
MRFATFLRGLSAILFGAALAAYLTGSPNSMTPIFAGSIALFGVSLVLDSGPVRERIPMIRSPGTKLRRLYEGGLALREDIRGIGIRGEPTPPDEWEPKIFAWDDIFWSVLNDVAKDRVVAVRRYAPDAERALHRKQYRDDSDWRGEAMVFLDGRLKLLQRLLEEVPLK